MLWKVEHTITVHGRVFSHFLQKFSSPSHFPWEKKIPIRNYLMKEIKKLLLT